PPVVHEGAAAGVGAATRTATILRSLPRWRALAACARLPAALPRPSAPPPSPHSLARCARSPACAPLPASAPLHAALAPPLALPPPRALPPPPAGEGRGGGTRATHAPSHRSSLDPLNDFRHGLGILPRCASPTASPPSPCWHCSPAARRMRSPSARSRSSGSTR